MIYKSYVQLLSNLYSVANGSRSGDLDVGYSNVDWYAYFSFLDTHHTTPLVSSLHLRAGIDKHIGEEERLYLSTVYDANLERNQNIILQYRELRELLSLQDIPVLPLKGLALLMDSAYLDPGARILIDIDILVPKDSLARAVDVLLENGYEQENNQYAIEGLVDFRNLPEFVGHHVPKLIKAHCEAPIEIHMALDSPMIKARHERLLAFAWSSSVTDELVSDHTRVTYSSDIFQILHCVYSSLIKDRGTLLGIVDFRHLEDYGYLRKKITQNDQLSQLYIVADEIGVRADLDYFHYQYRRYLCSDTKPNAGSIKLQIKAMYLTHIHKIPFIASFIFAMVEATRYIRHLFSITSLKRQFGPITLRRALWLRLTHVSRKIGDKIKALFIRKYH